MHEALGGNEILALFLGILVIGSPVLLPAIFLAMQGELDPWRLALVAATVMWLSDSAWYCAGRLVSLERLRRFALLARGIERLEAACESSSAARLLFLSRFLYGSKIAANVWCGIVRLRYRDVVLVNLASAVLWLALLFLAAFAIGTTLDRFLTEGESMSKILASLALFALAMTWFMGRVGARRIEPRRNRKADGAWPASVSVVIPACNEEAYLEAALRSVRRQRFPAEVIVVENGSSDGTAAIALRLADRVVRSPKPLGYSRARNLGAARAEGELLVFLDADSRMAADALDEIRARAAPGCFGTVLGRPDRAEWRYRIFFALKNSWQRIGLYRGVLGGLLFSDAQLFRRVGGFDEAREIDELRAFVRAAGNAGGRYSIVEGTSSVTSMRRFQSVGLARSLWFWLRLRLRLARGTDYVNARHRPDEAPSTSPASVWRGRTSGAAGRAFVVRAEAAGSKASTSPSAIAEFGHRDP